MKIDKNILEDHQAQLTVEVEADVFQGFKRRAARQIAKRGKIPGFRPGKAPYDVIVRNYGEAAIIEQAVDMLVDDIYPKVLEEAEIKPAAAGSLENIEELDPPKLVFKVPLAPEVDLGNYRAVRLPYKWKKPGKKELEKSLDELRQMYATTETVDRAVEVGDFVMLDVKGEPAKPKADEEDRRAALSREGFAVRVKEDSHPDEWPFEGFSKELIGLKPEESKTIKHKFPKDHTDESLAGETVNYTVTVKNVRSMTLPELDDDFAKMIGQFETLDELKEAVQKDLEARSEAEYDDEYFVELIDKIKEKATLKYPPQIVEHEAEHVLEDLSNRLSQQGLDLETYFKIQNTTQEKFLEEEARPVAIKRLERSLIMDEIARREEIELDQEDLQNEYGQALTELQQQGFDLSQVKGGKRGQQQVAEAVAMQSASRVITRRTLERLKAIATGELAKQEKAAKEAAAAAEKDEKTEAGETAQEEAQPKAKSAKKAKNEATVSKAKKAPANKKSKKETAED
ncbi:MAG: trigger factor [Anaerolineales bacterium]